MWNKNVIEKQLISMSLFSMIIVLPSDIKWVRKLKILQEIYQHFPASKTQKSAEADMKQKLNF